MAGYHASARLTRGVPRFASARGRDRTDAPASAAPRSHDPAREVDRIELVGHPLGRRWSDWLASIGESWSQTTFYLFDPESWR
jgi:hypothetical protein